MSKIAIGIKRHPWFALANWVAAFSVLWTSVAAVTYFIPSIRLQGTVGLLVMVAMGMIYAILRSLPLKEIELQIQHTNLRIQIKFGDLFAEPGYRVIAVSEYFESELGAPVSETSVHGLFLKKFFGGHPEAFDAIINKELSKVFPVVTQKPIGKNRKYPIGTTAVVSVNEDKYLCFALCEADPTTCKVSADVLILWNALRGLWQKARASVGGHPINVPLVGSGLSGVGLPSRELLNLLILSIIDETKRKAITEVIRIVVSVERMDQIDLRETKRYWR